MNFIRNYEANLQFEHRDTVSIDALKCIIPIVPKLGQQFSVVGIVDKGY